MKKKKEKQPEIPPRNTCINDITDCSGEKGQQLHIPHCTPRCIVLPHKVKLRPDKRICKAENRKHLGNYLKTKKALL